MAIKILVQYAADVELETRDLFSEMSLAETVSSIQDGLLQNLRVEAGQLLAEVDCATLISKGPEAEFTVAKHVVHFEGQGVSATGLHVIDTFLRHPDSAANTEAVGGIINHIGLASNNMMTRLYAATALQELGEESGAAEVFGSMLQDDTIHVDMVEEILDRVESLPPSAQRGIVGGLLVLAEGSDLAVPISVRQRADRILDELLPNR